MRTHDAWNCCVLIMHNCLYKAVGTVPVYADRDTPRTPQPCRRRGGEWWARAGPRVRERSCVALAVVGDVCAMIVHILAFVRFDFTSRAPRPASDRQVAPSGLVASVF